MSWRLVEPLLASCAAGLRTADERECLAAVRAATVGTELQVRGLKLVAAAGVPSGCSYSYSSKGALYNSHAIGSGSSTKRLACITEQPALGTSEPIGTYLNLSERGPQSPPTPTRNTSMGASVRALETG